MTSHTYDTLQADLYNDLMDLCTADAMSTIDLCMSIGGPLDLDDSPATRLWGYLKTKDEDDDALRRRTIKAFNDYSYRSGETGEQFFKQCMNLYKDMLTSDPREALEPSLLIDRLIDKLPNDTMFKYHKHDYRRHVYATDTSLEGAIRHFTKAVPGGSQPHCRVLV